MRISDWSSDVCSSDLDVIANAGRTTSQPQCSHATGAHRFDEPNENVRQRSANERRSVSESVDNPVVAGANGAALPAHEHGKNANSRMLLLALILTGTFLIVEVIGSFVFNSRSDEHTSELQSLLRISYDVFCLKKK